MPHHPTIGTPDLCLILALQVLQAATLNPARFLGRTDELGTVEEGKLADLVFRDAILSDAERAAGGR